MVVSAQSLINDMQYYCVTEKIKMGVSWSALTTAKYLALMLYAMKF